MLDYHLLRLYPLQDIQCRIGAATRRSLASQNCLFLYWPNQLGCNTLPADKLQDFLRRVLSAVVTNQNQVIAQWTKLCCIYARILLQCAGQITTAFFIHRFIDVNDNFYLAIRVFHVALHEDHTFRPCNPDSSPGCARVLQGWKKICRHRH